MQHELADIAGSQWDVVVIGAGINGAATARELTMAGYSVLLCEKGDFAGGASGRSSRMLHCGLRYFEAEAPVRAFGLHPRRLLQAMTMARAGMEARHEIATTAPEAVTPFTMCFPVYPESPVRPWHLDAGLALLKTLGPSEPPLEYRRITADFEARLPFAKDLRDRDRLQSIATYREYVFDWPDRFCVDAALEAEAGGATVLNFCSARLVERGPAGLWEIALEARDGSTATVGARLVFNMAGTWIDGVNAGAGEGSTLPRRLIRGTKGSHVMVRLPEAYRGYGIATLHRQGMPFYCLPSHDDFFYFGPTETPFEGDAGDISATEADIDFLLGEANFLLPGLGLTRNDVVLTWAGVRPLTFDADQPMGRRSREIHDLSADGLPGVLAMTAGPVMSHRSAARTMRERAEAMLGRPSRAVVREPAPWRITKHAPRLSEAEPSGNLRRAALRRAVSDEHARDLKGILYTRTALAWRRHLARHEVEDAAASVADLLAWTPEQSAEAVDHFLAYQRTVFRAGTPDRSYAMPTSTGDMQP
ncbi:FAD-dependent oxidoreductase [Aurantimonas sp. 22II-16-19i]|uniref:FAD-dependent oxidoreductase n=1 Tax=Aurantimonas sp. 22II-16-19i TaxID=1317114 RepID=UPI0009F7F382|nr:FAD-dependent oxidoreductase [Aurantimonas sp. 22II-16-19i]ORE95097.1 FAD dependent oxidoreductase [Aurantimonas sp. 22II-16-19i]